jgi:hypothetical protein
MAGRVLCPLIEMNVPVVPMMPVKPQVVPGVDRPRPDGPAPPGSASTGNADWEWGRATGRLHW